MTDAPKQTHEYDRRILLVVIGMTPQIVTETLYKLAVQQEPAFVPTEVHLITTKEGANSATLALLGVEKDQGWFQQFKEDYDFPGIQFDESNIHVITDTEGQFIDDNQSTDHNRIASDFITNKVKEFTADDKSAVHVSLAGGRKTMSFYAGYALSLYGRGQDRLSHVLVSNVFQNNKDFFYPRPKPERIEIDNRYYSTNDAKIIFSDIPYVRMRYQIPQSLLDGTAGYQETVEKIQLFMQPETVVFNVAENIVEFNTILVEFVDSDFAFYLWMCERKIAGESPLVLDADEFMSDYLEVYARVVGQHSGMYGRAEEVAIEKTANQQKDWFLQRKAKTKQRIQSKLGKRPALPFLIQTVGRKKEEAYTISLPPDAIKKT